MNPSSQLHSKLIGYLQDTHALENNVLQMLDNMISTTHDTHVLGLLRKHREETVQHEQRLAQRLAELGNGRSITGMTMDAFAMAGGMLKGVADMVRADKAGKNIRDAYVTEHVEIAAYELLERLALRAGDTKTAELARQNRADEYAFAKEISGLWDKAIDLTLAEAGIHSSHPSSAGRSSEDPQPTARTQEAPDARRGAETSSPASDRYERPVSDPAEEGRERIMESSESPRSTPIVTP